MTAAKSVTYHADRILEYLGTAGMPVKLLEGVKDRVAQLQRVAGRMQDHPEQLLYVCIASKTEEVMQRTKDIVKEYSTRSAVQYSVGGKAHFVDLTTELDSLLQGTTEICSKCQKLVVDFGVVYTSFAAV